MRPGSVRPAGFRRFGWLLASLALIGVMTGLVSYSVTLYRLFCQVTGAGGTTQRVAADTATPIDRFVVVNFDTNVAPGLDWGFRPMQRSVRVRLGEETLVSFEAENRSDQDIVGRATFNVTPDKAGPYFKKIECFCFTEEKLAAHAKVQMPVQFYVDPDMASAPGTADVTQITLSYTFFRAKDPAGAQDLARFDNPPTAAEGETQFAHQCAACHAADAPRVGPPLRGVVGRASASVADYPYSRALRGEKLVWTPAALDRWLAAPRSMVPGTTMPITVADPRARAAIIAYLTQLGTEKPRLGRGS